MVSKEPDTSASSEEQKNKPEEEGGDENNGTKSPEKETQNNVDHKEEDVPEDSDAVPETQTSDNTALTRITSAKRPTSLESQPDDSSPRHKGLAKNGFDRLEIHKPKLTGKLSDSAIECASRHKEKTPLREKLSDSVIHQNSRRERRSRNSSSGEERDEISSLIGGTSINQSIDSVFDDGIAERSPRRTHSHRRREGSHRTSPRTSDVRRSRRSTRTSSSGDHSRKPSVRRPSTATPSHGQRKMSMSIAQNERRESEQQPYNAQQLDYLRRKSKKFHGPYMSPGLNIAHSYRNPGAEILMAVLIILVGFVALIVYLATRRQVWLIVGAVCCAIGGLFMTLGLCWYCATPRGKDPAYSVSIPGVTRNRNSQRESTRSRRSHMDEEEVEPNDQLLMEKLERRSTPASPIPV